MEEIKENEEVLEPKRKETVGELSAKTVEHYQEQDTHDTAHEVNKTYLEECWKTIKAEPHCHWKDPWFLVVLQKREALMENVIRRYFFGRQTMPTPQFDQTVWYYDPKSTDLRHLWSMPDPVRAYQMAMQPETVHKDEFELATTVQRFFKQRLRKYWIKELGIIEED